MLFKFSGLEAHRREETSMEYCGIDVHQKNSEICTLAEDGEDKGPEPDLGENSVW